MDIDVSVDDSHDDLLLGSANDRHREKKQDNLQTKRLLELRQSFRKTMSNLARAQSHLNFSLECEADRITPKGLRCNVHCHALMKETTTVELDFKNISEHAEGGYVSALTTHYASLVEKLTTEAAKIQEDMRNAVATANPAVAEIHNNLLRKTMENLDNLREKLDAKKTSKMNWIKNNPHKEKTRPPRGRGGGDRGRGGWGGERNQRGGGAQRGGSHWS